MSIEVLPHYDAREDAVKVEVKMDGKLAGTLIFAGITAFVASAIKAKAGVKTDASAGLLTNPTPAIRRFAEAIARAEGFYVAGSVPQRANNPGALILPNWQGPRLGKEGQAVFASAEEGWQRLWYQLQLIATGKSSIYLLNDTIATMARKWAPGGAENWARNVSRFLDVSENTRIGELLK
jgi:hypothetical protein